MAAAPSVVLSGRSFLVEPSTSLASAGLGVRVGFFAFLMSFSRCSATEIGLPAGQDEDWAPDSHAAAGGRDRTRCDDDDEATQSDGSAATTETSTSIAEWQCEEAFEENSRPRQIEGQPSLARRMTARMSRREWRALKRSSLVVTLLAEIEELDEEEGSEFESPSTESLAGDVRPPSPYRSRNGVDSGRAV
jgi:hypothetical protein